jgi:hypothetical protein
MAKGRKDSEESSSLEESDNRTQSSGTESDSVRSRSKEKKVSFQNSSALFYLIKARKEIKEKVEKSVERSEKEIVEEIESSIQVQNRNCRFCNYLIEKELLRF